MPRFIVCISLCAAAFITGCAAREVTVQSYVPLNDKGAVAVERTNGITVAVRALSRFEVDRIAGAGGMRDFYRRKPLMSVFFFTVENTTPLPLAVSPDDAMIAAGKTTNDAYSLATFKDAFPTSTYIQERYRWLFTGTNMTTVLSNETAGMRFMSDERVGSNSRAYGFIVFPQTDLLAGGVVLFFPPLYSVTAATNMRGSNAVQISFPFSHSAVRTMLTE